MVSDIKYVSEGVHETLVGSFDLSSTSTRIIKLSILAFYVVMGKTVFQLSHENKEVAHLWITLLKFLVFLCSKGGIERRIFEVEKL